MFKALSIKIQVQKVSNFLEMPKNSAELFENLKPPNRSDACGHSDDHVVTKIFQAYVFFDDLQLLCFIHFQIQTGSIAYFEKLQ